MTYFGLCARWEQRPTTIVLHTCLWPFSPFLSRCIFFLSFSVSLCQVFLGLPLFPFRVSDCCVMSIAGFPIVCPIYLHFLFFISFSTGSCLILSHSVVLDSLSDHFRCKIRCLVVRILLRCTTALQRCLTADDHKDRI